MKSRSPLLLLTLRYILSVEFIAKTLLFSLAYLILAFSIFNFEMIVNITTLPYPILLKLKVILFSFWGYFYSSSELSAYTTLLISLLFGLNSAFIFTKSQIMMSSKTHRKVGLGAGIVLIISTCCVSCGISLFSILGVGGVLVALPFKGYELSLLALAILIISLYLNIRSINKACKLPAKN